MECKKETHLRNSDVFEGSELWKQCDKLQFELAKDACGECLPSASQVFFRAPPLQAKRG